MKVKLIAYTPDALQVMYTAARTCYSEKTPIEIWEEFNENKAIKLLTKVLGSGHLSIAESVNFTFAICGISRAIANQLTRHRCASYAQQSSRYVKFKVDNDKLNHLSEGLSGLNSEDIRFLKQYFVFNEKTLTVEEAMAYAEALKGYQACIKMGKPAEEARDLLPLALKTNLVMTCNLRELSHICGLRLCTRAQLPIRQLVKEMADQVIEVIPFTKSYLVTKCDQLGFCDEANSCGRKPVIVKN